VLLVPFVANSPPSSARLVVRLLIFFDGQRPRPRRDDVQVVHTCANIAEIVGLLAVARDATAAMQLVRAHRRAFRKHLIQERHRPGAVWLDGKDESHAAAMRGERHRVVRLAAVAAERRNWFPGGRAEQSANCHGGDESLCHHFCSLHEGRSKYRVAAPDRSQSGHEALTKWSGERLKSKIAREGNEIALGERAIALVPGPIARGEREIHHCMRHCDSTQPNA
jgi:hypothetical protein